MQLIPHPFFYENPVQYWLSFRFPIEKESFIDVVELIRSALMVLRFPIFVFAHTALIFKQSERTSKGKQQIGNMHIAAALRTAMNHIPQPGT